MKIPTVILTMVMAAGMNCERGLAAVGLSEKLAPRLSPEPPAFAAPLIFKQGATTERALRADELAWFEKYLVPAVSKSWEGQPWKNDALAYLRERLFLLGWRHPTETFPSWKCSAAKLEEAGCTDPWIRLFGAWDRGRSGKFDGAKDMAVMTTAMDTIRDSAVDPALKRFAALPMLIDARYFPKTEDRAKQQAAIMEKMIEWSAGLGSSPCYQGKDGDLLFRHLRKLPFIRLDKTVLLAAMKRAGTMPQWVVDTFEGELEVAIAWKHRGDGWASSVTDEGWKGFHEHLTRARRFLVAAWKARPDQPHAASEMIVVVMGDGAKTGENQRLWFDRATAACSDYYSAYVRYLTAMEPKWGGSYDTMLAFGNACVDSKRFDTWAPLAYFDVLNTIGENLKDHGAVYQHKGVPERVREVNLALLAAAAEGLDKTDRYALMAVDGWLCGDWKTCYEGVRGCQGKATQAAYTRLNDLGAGWYRLSAQAALYGGEGGETALKAEACTKSGDYAGAVSQWQEWMKSPPADKAAKGAGEAALRAAEVQKAFEAGEWVKLPVRETNDWDWVNGSWSKKETGTLTSSGSGSLRWATYPLRTGPHFELRAKVKLTGLKPGEFATVLLGAGFNPRSNYSCLTAAASLNKEGVLGWMGENSSDTEEVRSKWVDRKQTDSAELMLRRTDAGLTYVLNSVPVYEDLEETPGNPEWEKGIVALGTRRYPVDCRMVVESVEARKLP